MHLTFVNTEGLEQSALSITAREKRGSSNKMAVDDDDEYTSCDYDSDSDRESGFLVINENSPLLRNLDPPGTVTREGGGYQKRRGYNTLLNFKIRRNSAKTKGFPMVVIVTIIGMAIMVILGFASVLQDKVKVGPTDAPNSVVEVEEFKNNFNDTAETTGDTPTTSSNDIVINDNSVSINRASLRKKFSNGYHNKLSNDKIIVEIKK